LPKGKGRLYIPDLMKLRAVLILAAGLVLPGVQGAGPDDLYLDAYRLIQEADQFAGAGQADMARQRYTDAETNLKKIQGSYPQYNRNAVEFRLEYVRERANALPPAREGQPAPAATPARPTARTPQDQIAELNTRVAQLEADNGMLQAKLREALAPQPAALDPHEFARAQERITQLEKEKELLRASLQHAEAKQPQAADTALLDQARGELEATKKRLVETVASLAAITQENQRLQQQASSTTTTADSLKETQSRLAALEQERTQWQAQRTDLETRLAAASRPSTDSAKARDLEKERDALQKRLNDTTRELNDLRARGQVADRATLTNQLANLRARLEVFEARKVPYTREELALMDRGVAAISPKVETRPARRNARELPPGAAIIIADAERAFVAKRFADAEAKYKQVLDMDDENPVSLANLAAIQLELQKLDEAEKNLRKAISVSPDDAYAVSLLGMLRFQQENYQEALDHLSRAAQLDPKNAETQNYLGITLSQQGQREAAETALRKAVTLNPNYGGAHHNLAVIYATQRPPFLELARFHYNKALSLGHSASPELEKQLTAK
jgi:tetratricopeptide (TPR) repeat protein